MDEAVALVQESCIIKGSTTAKYFKLGKTIHWGDPLTAYIFTPAVEVAFIITNADNNMDGLTFMDIFFTYCKCIHMILASS